MNAYINDSKQMLGRAKTFCTDHTAILGTSAQAIVPRITASIAEIDTLGGSQFAGFAQFQSGAALRREAAKKIRQMLVDIAQTARVLDQAGTHPGLGESLRVGKSTRSYQALRDAGTAFATVLADEAVNASYTTRGYPATFIDDLEELVEALDTAGETKHGGVNKRVNSTANLSTACSKGVAAVRDLDAILSPQLRTSDPGLYAEWKRATHIRSRPKPEKAETPATPEQPLAAAVVEEEAVVSEGEAPAPMATA